MDTRQRDRQQQSKGNAAAAAHELRERLAEQGDFSGLLEAILQAPRGVLDLRHAFGQLRDDLLENSPK